MKTFPKARKEKLIVRKFADELLVYDKKRHKAHSLNRTAALIWKHCDGRSPVPEITQRVATEMGGTVNERLVWYALKQFDRDHLLEEKLEVPARLLTTIGGGFNRRQMMRALGITAVAALPLVTSMIAPTPARAASCLPGGASCTSSAQCCSGACINSICGAP